MPEIVLIRESRIRDAQIKKDTDLEEKTVTDHRKKKDENSLPSPSSGPIRNQLVLDLTSIEVQEPSASTEQRKRSRAGKRHCVTARGPSHEDYIIHAVSSVGASDRDYAARQWAENRRRC